MVHSVIFGVCPSARNPCSGRRLLVVIPVFQTTFLPRDAGFADLSIVLVPSQPIYTIEYISHTDANK